MNRLAAILAALLPAAALASADSVPNVNPRDMGMAQSLVAAQDGAGAVFANPAALSRLEGLDLSLAVSLLDNKTTWTTTTGLAPSPVSSDFHPATPPAIFAAYGGKLGGRGWGVGAGLSIPEGGNIVWPADWPGRDRIVKVDRKVFGIYLNGGVEIIPQLRLGGGLIYYYTTEYLRQYFASGSIYAHIEDSGGSPSFDASAEITPVPGVPFTIGIDYKHQSVQKLTGKATFETTPAVQQNATHMFTVPNSLNVGVAWRPTPPLLLAFTWTWDRFEVYAEDRFVSETGLQVVVPRNYGNGNTFRGGAEYTLSPRFQVRAGLLRDLTGMKTQYYSPSLPDGDVWAGTAGASYLFGKGFGVHAAVFYAHYAEVDTTGQPPAFPGTWQSRAWIYSLGFTWRRAPETAAR